MNFSVNEVYQLIEEILKTGLRPVYKPDLPGEAEITLADITASKGLGWEPRVDIGEGLIRTIEYLRTKVLPAKVGFTGT